MPSVVLDFRAQATITHLKLKGFFKCFLTASAEAKPAVIKGLISGLFLCALPEFTSYNGKIFLRFSGLVTPLF